MYLYSCAEALCAQYVGVLNTGSDVDISDSKQHKKKTAKVKKMRARDVEIYKYERRTEEELYMAVCLGFIVCNETDVPFIS